MGTKERPRNSYTWPKSSPKEVYWPVILDSRVPLLYLTNIIHALFYIKTEYFRQHGPMRTTRLDFSCLKRPERNSFSCAKILLLLFKRRESARAGEQQQQFTLNHARRYLN